MSAKNIPLFDVKLHGSAIRETHQTLLSGWLTTGPRATAFEAAVAEFCGVKYAVALNSATSGLLLSLRAFGVGKGDEVITTPFTFVATVEAILQAGATPVLCDIDPATLLIDPEQARHKITRRAKALLPVDLAGHSSNYEAIHTLAGEHRLSVLSDSSHAFGATYRGKPIPQYTDVSVFSFHSTKNLTCGEGGMVVSRNRKLADQIRLLSRHAMTRNAYQRRAEGKWEYDVVDLGFKANMSDIHAAIGLGQLRHFDDDQSRRARLAARYTANLSGLQDFLHLPAVQPDCRHAWHLYVVQLQLNRLAITRNQFIGAMAKRGIECGVHYRPVFEMSHYRRLGYSGKQFPHAAGAGKKVVSLPMFAGLSMGKVDYVCDAIRDILTAAVRPHRVR